MLLELQIDSNSIKNLLTRIYYENERLKTNSNNETKAISVYSSGQNGKTKIDKSFASIARRRSIKLSHVVIIREMSANVGEEIRTIAMRILTPLNLVR